MLEALSPVAIKNALLTALSWQARHGKALVHVGFYLRTAWYTEKPRQSQTCRGAGLAWVGRHPERETDESLERKRPPPKRLKEVLMKMSLTAGIAKHA